MNSILSKKFNTSMVILLVTAFLLPAFAAARMNGQDGPGSGKGFGMNRNPTGYCKVWRNPKMVQTLKLSDEQVKAIKEADFSSREKALPLKGRLDELRLQMEKAFSADTVDEPAMLELARQVSDVKGKLFVQHIQARLAVEKILTPEQRKILESEFPHRHAGPERERRHAGFCDYGRNR